MNEKVIKIGNQKIQKMGTLFYIRIPKQLVSSEIVKEGETYNVVLEKIRTEEIESIVENDTNE